MAAPKPDTLALKLILDEMHSPAIALELGRRGHEVVAIASDPALRGLADADVLVVAAAEDRALVTENIADFMTIHSNWLVEGRQHSGLIFTSRQRFYRGMSTYPGNVVIALDRLLRAEGERPDSWLMWLH